MGIGRRSTVILPFPTVSPNNKHTMALSMKCFSQCSLYRLLLALLALVTVAVYFPGLSGQFAFDDGANIEDNAALRVATLSWDGILSAAMSGKSGPLGRPISMLSFAANYYFTQFDPYFFKLFNVFIHLLAGFAVYLFTRELSLALDRGAASHQRFLLAKTVGLTTAGIWLVHPLNVTSVLYVVQRMTSLAALFTFCALALYVCGRRKVLGGQMRVGIVLILMGLGPVTALALLSKENGVLTPYLMLCVELVVFKFAAPQKSVRTALIFFFAAIVLVPAAIGLANFSRIESYVIGGYAQRDFSLLDRLLTQPHVLMFYLRLLILPSASSMGIYHDDFPVSTSLFQSSTTFLSVVAVLTLIAVGVIAIRKAPALAFGLLWFFVGHSLESTFLSLEMVHEHRNYLPIVGPIFTGAYYLWRTDIKPATVLAKWCIAAAALSVYASVTFGRSLQWSNVVDHIAMEVHNHPNSERANFEMGRVYSNLFEIENDLKMAKLADQYLERAGELGRSSIFPATSRIVMAYKTHGVPAPELIETVKRRLQSRRPWEPNMVALSHLVNCQIASRCALADTDMVAMLSSALANPDAGQKTIATAHSLLGGYYAIKLGDIEKAGLHMMAAAEVEPNRIEYRLDLLRYYATIGSWELAKRELNIARTIDKWGLQRKRFDAESALLDATMKAGGN
jgi:protein O-mannosyl-transferase